jgi:hypothetical protein
VFSGDADLTGLAGVLQGPRAAMRGGLGDFLVGGLAKMLARQLDAPRALMSGDSENGSIGNFSHFRRLTQNRTLRGINRSRLEPDDFLDRPKYFSRRNSRENRRKS